MSERDFFYRRLPHWHPANATFFVTFRLEGSLPQSVIAQISEEYEQAKRLLESQNPEQRDVALTNAYKKAFARYERALDKADGPRWLSNPKIAQLVIKEIHSLSPQYYLLLAYCVMPNHIHLLINMEGIAAPPPRKDGTQYTAVSYALWLLKGRTGHACQKIIGKTGRFWQRESYDHVVRNEGEFQRILAYIANNPVKAGLVNCWQDWPYTYISPELL